MLLEVAPFLVGGLPVFGFGPLRSAVVEEGPVGAYEFVVEEDGNVGYQNYRNGRASSISGLVIRGGEPGGTASARQVAAEDLFDSTTTATGGDEVRRLSSAALAPQSGSIQCVPVDPMSGA